MYVDIYLFAFLSNGATLTFEFGWKVVKVLLTHLFSLYLPGLPSACYEDSVFELWAKDGEFDESVDREIETLTRDKILDKINNHNMRQVHANWLRPSMGMS